MAPCLQDVRRPTGINIFQLCKALLDGHAEKLSEKVLLHDGPVHLFDVCLQHDCWSIACEMASRGVEWCELQMQHLDPFDEFQSSDWPSRCTRTGWNECKSYCCWGLPVHQGTWMPDFDVGIWGACEAASKAVGRTWVGQCLRMASSGEKLPLAVSDGAMARLLDIAILTGNQKAATELAAKCKVLPLRRWRSEDFISRCGEMFGLQDVLVAALAAGKPVPGHLGISFAFGAFTVALACQKLLLLRCYLRPSGSYQPYGKFQPRCPCKCLGLHFKWCKYLLPSEVISRMESPSQDALASLAIKVQLSFFLLRLTTTI